jgi:predicted permease
MAHFLLAVETVLPLFLVIGIGLIFSRTKVFTPQWIDILNKYALYIGFPALVIASLMNLEPNKELFTQLIIHTSVYTVTCMLLAFPLAKLFRLSRNMLRTLFLILPFGNFAYLGIPVLQSTYGDNILPTAAILSAIYLFWLLTLGLVLIEAFGDDKISPRKLLLSLIQNPLLLSVFVGLAIGLFKVELPFIAEKTITLFSNSVTAIILFALGLFLGTQEFGKLKEWYTVMALVVVTMLLLPACYYAYLKMVGMNEVLLKASVLDAAMPLGLTPYVLTVQYKLESKLAARVVVLATFLSVFIIPLWMVWLG